ncbi:hypothetical protein [Streptomyces sp. NPDC000880]
MAVRVVTTEAEGLTSIDDLTFVGQGDTILAAQSFAGAIALGKPDGTHRTGGHRAGRAVQPDLSRGAR